MRGRLVRYVLVGGSHRIGVPVLIYLLSAFVASQGEHCSSRSPCVATGTSPDALQILQSPGYCVVAPSHQASALFGWL